MLKGIDHINLTVSDFDTTVAWYGRMFGFELVEEAMQDDTRWGVILSGEAMLCIYEFAEGSYEDRFKLRERGLHGINHFGLRIDDEDKWLGILEDEGIEVLYGGAIQWPHSKSWYIQDPTGYEIEVALWQADRIRFG